MKKGVGVYAKCISLVYMVPTPHIHTHLTSESMSNAVCPLNIPYLTVHIQQEGPS